MMCAVLLLLVAACGDSEDSAGAADTGASTADAGADTLDGDGDAPGAADQTTDPGEVPACASEPLGLLDLGVVSLDGDGVSPPLIFDLPECASGFTFLVTGPDGVTLILQTLASPSGEEWITDELSEPLDFIEEFVLGPFPAQFKSPNRMVAASGAVATLVPNNPSVQFEPGAYTAVIQGAVVTGTTTGGTQITPYEGDVEAEVRWKNQLTRSEGGMLDINVYLSGAGGITVENAAEDTFLASAADRLAEIYGAVNIEIGELRYFDVDERYRTITSIEGPGNDLSEMFRESLGNPAGLNFFLVDRFEIQGMPPSAIGGISGGVPGPPLANGSARSGVAVSLAAASNSASNLAHILGHEGGHYLGLFHTVEFFGGEDPLPDTPTGNDMSNLMFPTVGGSTELTEQQADVMHIHPEVAP